MTRNRLAITGAGLLAVLLSVAAGLPPALQAAPAQSSLAQGQAKLAHRQYLQAIKPLEQAVKEDPRSCAAHLCLGQAYAKTKSYPKARDQFRQAVRVGKGSANAQKANAELMALPKNLQAPRTGPQTKVISANLGLISRERGAEGASKPTVLDFYASWCQPCKQLQAQIDKMKGELGDKVNFVSINVDDPSNDSVIDQYGVSPIPTLVFLNPEGEVVTYSIGYSGAGLSTGIKKILASG